MNPFLRTLGIFLFILVAAGRSQAQKTEKGIITGNILEKETGKPIPDATVSLIGITDASRGQSIASTAEGSFSFNNVAYGLYRLRISAVGFNTLSIDSIRVRADRADFSLNDLKMTSKSQDMDAVVVYAEKPLVQSKGGNITFNAAESPLSAGSSANELLRNVPLVATDADGNLMLRGKTPRVLIDEKPVDLNARQLQDFLDALPGNMIEKIEVMTNPPPEYANEEGGVINITTRKGKIGLGGRVSVYVGTRGEAGANTNLSYRDRKFSLNVSGGEGYNRTKGMGWSKRQNIYPDSTNRLDIDNSSLNKNTRPSGRISMDYDIDKHNSLSTVWQINRNNFDNSAFTDYTRISAQDQLYGLTDRTSTNKGHNTNPNGNLSWRHRGPRPEESLEVQGSYNYSGYSNSENYYQRYLNPDKSFGGADSTQRQNEKSHNSGYEIRGSYDRPLTAEGKTLISLGGYYNANTNREIVTTSSLDKTTGQYETLDLYSSNFKFLQTKLNFRGSLRQTLAKGLVFTAGTALSRTMVRFDLYNSQNISSNHYWNWLPFANISKTWDNQWQLTLVYRRSIRRPGIDQMNPSIDYSDPYNLKFGNPSLTPTLGHEFDLHAGKSTSKYYFNYSIGTNIVQDIYSQITSLQTDGTTQTTWRNISSRTEYSTGTWSGYTFTRTLRANIGLSYQYNTYGAYDRNVNKYQNNGSFYSNVNMSYSPTRTWNFNVSCLYNRYGNPQGVGTATVNTNFGIQHKFFQKKFIATLNVSDPFVQQSNHNHTYGPDFNLESYSRSNTRNYRLTLSWDWNKSIDRGRRQLLRAAKMKE